MIDQSPVQFSIEIAQSAGNILMDYFGSNLTKSIKTTQDDFSTEADLAAEKFILSEIKKNFSADAIIAEESGIHETHRSEYTWIVDPLDGTYHFAEGKDIFGVMITRAYKEVLQLAVIYNPVRNILATAVKDEGCFINGDRVDLTKSPDLEEKPVCVEKSDQERIQKGGYKIINEGASANTLATLSGERSAYISSNGFVWDWAPPALLLAEAGLTVTDFQGQPFNWETSEGVVSALATPHEHFLSLLRK